MDKEKGFTLIELMIVIAIIGILAAVAVPKYMDWRKKANAVEARVMLDSIRTHEEQYFSENDAYTTNLTSLGNPTANGKYYTFSIALSPPDDYIATASPSAAGAGMGLTGTWTVDKGGNFGGTAVTSGNFY